MLYLGNYGLDLNDTVGFNTKRRCTYPPLLVAPLNTELWPLIRYAVCIQGNIQFHTVLLRSFNQMICILWWKIYIQRVCLLLILPVG